MSAVEMGKALKSNNSFDEEITQYEKKLVQVTFLALLIVFSVY